METKKEKPHAKDFSSALYQFYKKNSNVGGKK